MANYEATARSNYFKVVNEKKFREYCRRWNFEVIERGRGRGKLLGFVVRAESGLPTSYYDEEKGEDIDGYPLNELAEHLAPGHVAVFMEVGHEKARFMNGYACAINSAGETADLELHEIVERARHLGKHITGCEC